MDAFQIPRKHHKGCAFPPFNLIGRVFRKVQMDQTQILLITTSARVSLCIYVFFKYAILIPKVDDFFNGPKDKKTPINGEGKIKTSGLGNFREELLAECISKNTADLIIGGTRGGLVTHYELAQRKRDI